MRRDLAKAKARKLAPLMAALNAAPVDAHGADPLVGPFAKEWVKNGIVFRAQYDKDKAAKEPLGKLLKQYAGNRKAHPEFARNPLHDELSKLFDRKAQGRSQTVETGGDLLRSARRFRAWIATCIKSRAAAGRLMRDLEGPSRSRLSLTDRIAAGYLSRIVSLGIFRCGYAKCGKLVLNTSGHRSRKFCTGTECAQNDKSARIMAQKFAKVQEGKIRQANAAIAKWPGTGDLKKWIVDHTDLSRRWITEAARRGDIRVRGEKQRTTPRRRRRAPSLHAWNDSNSATPIKKIPHRPSDDWEDDLRKRAPLWIHNGKDGRGLFKKVEDWTVAEMIKEFGGEPGKTTVRVYRHFCRKCGEEVGTLPICPECKAEHPRRPV